MSELVGMKLDPDTGDLWMSEAPDGSPIGGAIVEDLDAIAQRLRTRLQMFRGTWFLNKNAGVPYYKEILGKKGAKDPSRINAVLVEAILGTPGIFSFSGPIIYDFDNATRLLKFTFRVLTIFGNLDFSSDQLTQGGIPL